MADHLRSIGTRLGSRAQWNHPLGALTTYRVGGSAALFVTSESVDDLLEVAIAIDRLPIPILVIGRGSNMLVADQGFAGIVVSLGSGHATINIDGTRVTVGGAVSLPVLARQTVAAGLNGLAWAVGVPGSVGGAVRMNAGGHGSDIVATLDQYQWVDLQAGTLRRAGTDALRAGYRTTSVEAAHVVVSAEFLLSNGDAETGAETITDIVRWRRANQPGGSNAGSVFTNPEGDSAGRIIEAAGLKGYRIGGAEVSGKHANFIQADVGSSADDVRELIGYVRSEVLANSGIELQTEIRMVGFDPKSEGAQ